MNEIDHKINEMIVEIRYKPNPTILDKRGELTNEIYDTFKLKHWKIDANRIDFFNSDSGITESFERLFLSYRNFGLVYRNIPSSRDIISTNNRYINTLNSIKNLFSDKFLIERIGIKSRFANIFDGDFSELFELYKSNYIMFNNDISAIFGADLIDIGVYSDHKKSDGTYIRTLSGPMEKDQIKHFFPFDSIYPETIFYFEIDTFIHPNNNKSMDDIKQICKDYFEYNWSTNENLFKKLLGE